MGRRVHPINDRKTVAEVSVQSEEILADRHGKESILVDAKSGIFVDRQLAKEGTKYGSSIYEVPVKRS